MQEEVERALAVVLRAPVPVVVAGRTDAGVHALGQVCSYPGEPVAVAALNALLPEDVAALSCSAAAEGSTRAATRRRRAYTYLILNRRAAELL